MNSRDTNPTAVARCLFDGVDDLQCAQAFASGNQRFLGATNDAAEVLDLQAQRILVYCICPLDRERLQPGARIFVAPYFQFGNSQ